MSHSDFCICCTERSDLVSVHEELSIEGYICTQNNAAALVEQCFNIKILSCEVLYAICSSCVNKVVQSCILKDQLVHNLQSAADIKDGIDVKQESYMETEVKVESSPSIESKMKEECTGEAEIEYPQDYEDANDSDDSLDDPSFMADYEKSTKKEPKEKAAESNSDRAPRKKLRSSFTQENKVRLTKSFSNVEPSMSDRKTETNYGREKDLLNVKKEGKQDETPLVKKEQSSKTNDKVKKKTVGRVRRSNFNSLLLNCKDFGLFSWYKSKYKCLVCNEEFPYRQAFRIHALEHTCEDVEGVFPKKKLLLPKGMKVDISLMKCRHCDDPVTDMEGFHRHLSLSHNIQADDILLGQLMLFNLTDGNVKCGFCNKDFVSMSILNEHMNEHSTNYICPHCAKFFISLNRLRNHMRNMHMSPGIFKCTRCDESFETLHKRKYHISLAHGTRQHLCPHCPETFKSLTYRIRHLAEVHNEELRRHKCDKCPAAYITAKDLNRHILHAHLQERNHSCSVCGDAFFNAGLLKCHMVRHTGERTFVCQICNKGFLRTGNLRRHMTVHNR